MNIEKITLSAGKHDDKDVLVVGIDYKVEEKIETFSSIFPTEAFHSPAAYGLAIEIASAQLTQFLALTPEEREKLIQKETSSVIEDAVIVEDEQA